MNRLSFDENGNLTPYELIELDLESINSEFVARFPNSVSRLIILNAFRDYVAELRVALDSPFDVWINGSFTTEKLNPNDIDFVVFVDTVVVGTHLTEIRQFRERRFGGTSVTDGYFDEVYPVEHPNHRIGLLNRRDRECLFGYDKQGNRKGIVRLLIS